MNTCMPDTAITMQMEQVFRAFNLRLIHLIQKLRVMPHKPRRLHLQLLYSTPKLYRCTAISEDAYSLRLWIHPRIIKAILPLLPNPEPGAFMTQPLPFIFLMFPL